MPNINLTVMQPRDKVGTGEHSHAGGSSAIRHIRSSFFEYSRAGGLIEKFKCNIVEQHFIND